MRIAMKTILMLTLLAATAHADAPTCKKEGAPIFEIDRKDTANPKSLQAAYKAGGKQVFEAHVCGAQTLDEDSNKAVQDLEKELAVAFPKT
jgi:hypothetical protein